MIEHGFAHGCARFGARSRQREAAPGTSRQVPAGRSLALGPGVLPRTVTALTLLVAMPAAADRIERGTVVTVEGDEIYVDVDRGRGVTPGSPVRFKRRVVLKNPTTGKPLEDELPLGKTALSFAGETLSMAAATPDVETVEPGDIVEVLVVGADPPAAAPTATTVDPDAGAMLDLWRASATLGLSARIAGWKDWLSAHPATSVAPQARAYLIDLEHLRDSLLDQAGTEPERGAQPVLDVLLHDPPRQAAPGRSLAVAFATRAPDDIVAAWLHVRRAGDATFRRVELSRDGDGYLRGELPAAAVLGPGVEYFAEVALRDADVAAAVGTAEAPVAVAVEAPTAADLFVERQGRSRITVQTSYLDFATFDDRDLTDRFVLLESDFLYRLRAGWLHGVRVGFGIFNGEGGYRDAPGAATGLNYGYVEAEARLAPGVAVMPRLVTGLGPDGIGFGIEGRVRLGPEEETNLVFEGSRLPDIGFLSGVRLEWRVLRAFPLGFGVAVTDQPAQGDLGVRFSADVGCRVLSWMQPTVRVSIQGRSLEHVGAGAGLGLVFDW